MLIPLSSIPILVGLLVHQVDGAGMQCKALSGSNCGCQLDNGQKIDLTPMTKLHAVPMLVKLFFVLFTYK